MVEKSVLPPVPGNWIETQVLRATRNSLIWNGISLSVLLLIVWLSSGYLYFFFRGPIALTDQQLLTVLEQNKHLSLMEYVELRDRTLIPTNWQEVTTEDGRPYSTVPFFLLPVGEGGHSYIVVLAKAQHDGRRLVGPISGARELDQRVINAIIGKNPEYKGHILPYVLSNVAAFNVAGYLLLTFLIPWGAYCLWNVARAIMSRLNPSTHSIERRLGAFGDDVAALAENINHEVQVGPVTKYGKSLLTNSWILRPTVFNATCVRLQDIVWVYHAQQSAESFVVTCLRTGKMMVVSLKAHQADELVRMIGSRVPWALVGYDKERFKQWKKDPNLMIRAIEVLKGNYE